MVVSGLLGSIICIAVLGALVAAVVVLLSNRNGDGDGLPERAIIAIGVASIVLILFLVAVVFFFGFFIAV